MSIHLRLLKRTVGLEIVKTPSNRLGRLKTGASVCPHTANMSVNAGTGMSRSTA